MPFPRIWIFKVQNKPHPPFISGQRKYILTTCSCLQMEAGMSGRIGMNARHHVEVVIKTD